MAKELRRLVDEIEEIFCIQADKDAGRLGQVERKTVVLEKLARLAGKR